MEQFSGPGPDRPAAIDRLSFRFLWPDPLLAHNRRAHDERWNRLSVIMAISTEPYLLIDSLHQSPFNVGLVLYLEDFDDVQVLELSRRYGLSLSAAEHADMMRLLHRPPLSNAHRLLHHGIWGDHLA